MSFFNKELSHDEFDFLELCKFVVKFWIKNILWNSLLYCLRWVSHCHTDRVLVHKRKEPSSKFHCLTSFWSKTISIEAIHFYVWIFFKENTNISTNAHMWIQRIISILLVVPLRERRPRLSHAWNTARPIQWHATWVEIYGRDSSNFDYFQVLGDH